MTKKLIEELKKCVTLESEKGFCGFNGGCCCHSCAAPALLYKLITGVVNDTEQKSAARYLFKVESINENS